LSPENSFQIFFETGLAQEVIIAAQTKANPARKSRQGMRTLLSVRWS